MGSAEESTIRLRSLEGEEVPWPRNTAQRAAFLKNLMDDAPTNDNVYPVSAVSTAVLVSLERLCDPDYDQSATLAEKSAQELFKLLDGSNFLDAAPALEHVQRALASLLDGKKVDELRGLLHATDDLTPEERVAALAEPIFMPVAEPIFMPVADGPQPAAAMAPPCLLQQPSLSGVEGTDDAKGLALCAVDIGTLTEFKGVNRFWGAVARHELCSRLCCREGQQAPQKPVDVIDLDVERLVRAGRPWDVAAAWRLLPSLSRLHGYGFQVSLAAVRTAHLPEEAQEGHEDEAEDLRAVLRSCIVGEGDPPLELLLAAVACAASGEVWSVPVRLLRDDDVEELDLHSKYIGPIGMQLLSMLLPHSSLQSLK
jgi:hypothetical protein